MVSEWARRKAASVEARSRVEIIAASLDEARREGVERERWECRQLAETVTDDHRLSYVECPRCGSHIADAIAARGPMRGPEEEE